MTNDFSQGNIYRTMLRISVPMIVSQMVSVLYNIIDRIFIGHIPMVGETALTGVGLCMPIIFIINAFGNLIGTGGAPLCSIARGKHDLETAEKLMCNSLTLLLIISTTLVITLSLALKPMLYLFGASDDTFPYAFDYMSIYCLGTIFMHLSLGMNAFINAQGFAKMGMFTVLIGAVLNLFLDPLFIFVLDMGIKGAAIATVISQAISAVWVLSFLKSRKAILHLQRQKMRLEKDTVFQILKMGSSGFIMNVTTSLVQIVANTQLLQYGGDLYVGVMTVVNSISQMFLMPIQGFTHGVQPVLGYNYGAREVCRLKKGIKFLTAVSLVYTVIMTAVMFIFTEQLIHMFNSASDAFLVAGTRAVHIYFAAFGFLGFMLVGQAVFQSFGKAYLSIMFSLLRKAIIVAPLMLILPKIGFGTDGVFMAELVSSVVGGLCCFFTMYFTQYRKL